MATNLGKFKGRKGASPPAGNAADAIGDHGPGDKAALRPLQVRIPARVFEEFSATAGREFGYTHGAKKQLFLKMWEAYKAQNIKA